MHNLLGVHRDLIIPAAMNLILASLPRLFPLLDLLTA